MDFAIYNPWQGTGSLIQEDQKVRWAIASARIYRCESCGAWHNNTEDEALQIWAWN